MDIGAASQTLLMEIKLYVSDAGYTVVRFQCQLRLSLRVFTYKGLKAARWRLSEFPDFS